MISFLDPLISHCHIRICIPPGATGIAPVRISNFLRVNQQPATDMAYEKVPLEGFKTVFGTQIGSYNHSFLAHRPTLTVIGGQSCPASPSVARYRPYLTTFSQKRTTSSSSR